MCVCLLINTFPKLLKIHINYFLGFYMATILILISLMTVGLPDLASNHVGSSCSII